MSTDRDLLAAALHAIGQEDGSGRDCSICISDADTLLPVVDRIANERAAAAREEGYEQGRREVAEYLDRVWQESHRAAAQALGEATS